MRYLSIESVYYLWVFSTIGHAKSNCGELINCSITSFTVPSWAKPHWKWTISGVGPSGPASRFVAEADPWGWGRPMMTPVVDVPFKTSVLRYLTHVWAENLRDRCIKKSPAYCIPLVSVLLFCFGVSSCSRLAISEVVLSYCWWTPNNTWFCCFIKEAPNILNNRGFFYCEEVIEN